MIDKVIPNKLQADLDERLLNPESGQIVDALNVTRQLSDGSTSGTIKNTYGTAAIPVNSSFSNEIVNNNDAVTVIGSVSDEKNSKVYWFVSDNAGSTEHAIYQVDTDTNNYRRVIKSSALNFSPTSFVKADVLSGQFQQNGINQTILFFTDNINPPRKINVERAIAGDYSGIVAESDFEHDLGDTISVVKAAETRSPSSMFFDDTSFTSNKFVGTSFQFATQYVYIDGEVSAISPYSSLAVSPSAVYSLQEGTSAASARPNSGNRCDITLNINPNKPDIEKIRLIGKEGNSGTFFVIDEFDPSSNVVRNIYGSDVNVYDSSSTIYRFYNDRNGISVSNTEVNKLFDNVPLAARGQALSGKRLVYSNYTEGRANATGVGVTMSVQYGTEQNGVVKAMSTSTHGSSVVLQADANPNVTIDLIGGTALDALSGGGAASASTVVPSGTQVSIGFKYQPTFTLTRADSGNLLSFTATQILGGGTSFGAGTLTMDTLVLDTLASTQEGSQNFLLSFTVSSNTTVSSLATLVSALLDEIEPIPVSYTLSSETISGQSGFDGTVRANGTCTVYYDFSEFNQDGGNTTVTTTPHVSRVDFSGVTFSVTGGSSQAGPVGAGSDVMSNVLIDTTPSQAEFSFGSVGSTYVSERISAMIVPGIGDGFKSGSTHSFGIVYYDQFNRSGFVNELGSVYVKDLPERSAGQYGPATVRIVFDDYTPPSWARRYQIVYAGRSSIGNFTQYTVGGGFRALKKSTGGTYTDSTPDSNSKRIYVSLKTLDLYQEQKGAARSYSFTKGDKLRVIKTRDVDGDADEYPTASDGTVIEFDVVGVETLGSDASTNPIGHSAVTDEEQGTFLVLESPATNSGALGTDGNALTYTGFDWDDMASNNYWDREVVVEIYSPKSEQEKKIYYEIGHGARVGTRKADGVNDHGDEITVYNGDVFRRPVACKTPAYVSSSWNSTSPEDWIYKTIVLESSSYTDTTEKTDWHRGRAHTVFENAAEVRRENGITYGDAYAEDVANLSISSFNPSLANFISLENAHGAVNYIESRGKGMVALQENKVAQISVDERIITQSDGGALSALATSPFALSGYYSGDFGCGEDVSAVIFRDGYVFFFDRSRNKILRLTSEGLSAISDLGVQSLINTNVPSILSSANSVVSGYDPRTNEYYFTFRPNSATSFLGLTLSYSPSFNGWQSRHSFYPDMYASQDNAMYTGFYVDPSTVSLTDQIIFHSHTDAANRTRFYGSATGDGSLVKVVFNNNPSSVKTFNAISYEGTPNSFDSVTLETSDGDLGSSFGFSQIEGSEYSSIVRDRSGDTYSNVIGLGSLIASSPATTNTLTFANRVNRIPIPPNSVLMLVSGGNLVNIGVGGTATAVRFNTVGSSVLINTDGNNINTSISGLSNGTIVAVPPSEHDGNIMRGHWCSADFRDTEGTAPYELYALNAHTTTSKNNHALGQE